MNAKTTLFTVLEHGFILFPDNFYKPKSDKYFQGKKKVITQWPRKIFVIICLGILSAADYCQKRSAQLSGLKFKADILQSLVNSVLFLY